jgi:hypothetical protein
MANTFNDYTATSAQLDSSNAAYGFVFNFPFLDASHIVVEVDGSVLASSNYSIQTSPDKRVLVASGITAGQVVRVKRDSNADSDAPLVDFVNGSVLNETELDKSYLHNLYLNEEIAAMNDLSLQKKVGDTTKWDAKSQELVNVTDPTLVQSASTKNYVDTQISNTITGSTTVSSKYTFTGDNTTTAFTFNPAINLDGDTMYEVAIDGVLQEPTTAYAIDANANTITFTSAPPTSASIVVVQRGYAVPVTINSQGLRVVDSSGISGTASFVQDGDSTNSALAISSTAVGIGTASPQHILDVRSTEDLTTFAGNQTPGVGIKNENTAVDNVALLAFKASQANTVLTGVGMINRNISSTATSSVGDLAFYSKPLGQSYLNDDPSMVIDSAGNCGIGTVVPIGALEVNANSTEIVLRGTSPSGLSNIDIKKTNSGDTEFSNNLYTGGTAGDFIFSNGKVGIGTTTSPTAPLEVSSTTGGVIMPRMTTAEMNAISSPTDGEMIYNTTANKFYGRASGSWVALH